MHYPGGHLLPGPKFITELLPPCQPHPEPFANTCHPLSITKSPAPRWRCCPQSATTATTTAATTSLLPCQPLVQPCLLLCPEPCETARLLPGSGGFGTPQTLPVSGSSRGDKKRVARSLPPCAPRCPEPGRLRFPPCGVRGSSASCRGQCRSHKVAKWPLSYPEPCGGYSLPLRGVTECPPPRRSLLQGYLHRCSKGYPTQELLGCCSSEQRLSSAGGVAKGAEEGPQVRVVGKGTQECPQVRVVTQECPLPRVVTKECPPLRAVTKVTKDCPPLRAVTKVTKECPPLRAVTKECPQLRAVTKVTKEYPPLKAVTKVTKDCPPLRAVTKVTKEYPPLKAVTKVTKECPPLRAVAKGSVALEGTKGRSCSAQHLSRSRCCPQHPRGPPRPSRLAPGGSKRCGHAKKSRCASKWLW
ncbi:uncharacterized protein LOC134563264 [Prinia subflava]|uniref:uncharacterized protein LOC134563264 n=1 Tax=Prinia subflava TaxID=208062 RepID=UPI002FE2001D